MDFINYVLCLNCSNFIVDAVNEGNHYHHSVSIQKRVGTPADPKPASSIHLTTGTMSLSPPVFPQARKMISNSADLIPKAADPAFTSIRVVLKTTSLLSPAPESVLESAPECQPSPETAKASMLHITSARRRRLRKKKQSSSAQCRLELLSTAQ